ncbi:MULTISPECIES: hypothetical protein [unclassified Pseudoalteromonas]|uniref:hypothetical protein n=1 Tax=unclassified Pseudoalteromonas TaxID=194690 RepID=UPI0020973D5B|nr:hypothetical protein [Pseudoalteromonas sp. XMcav2-N]MCO7190936.1 hypothetical protein [Pseudoalteromonas sp. XMcav2-N]
MINKAIQISNKSSDTIIVFKVSDDLTNVIDGLNANLGGIQDLLLAEFDSGIHIINIDADSSLKYAGTMDSSKNGLITINPSAQSSQGRGMLVLGHEVVHFRDYKANVSNWSEYKMQTELNAFAWEEANYKNFIPSSDHDYYGTNIADNVRKVKNGTYNHGH